MIDYKASNIINAALNLDLKSAAGLEKFRKVVQSALEEAVQPSVQADACHSCGTTMNITVEKRKQNLAIDEAMKSFKNMKDILVAVYARGHRDARHSAAEKATQQSIQPDGAQWCACDRSEIMNIKTGLCCQCGLRRR